MGCYHRDLSTGIAPQAKPLRERLRGRMTPALAGVNSGPFLISRSAIFTIGTANLSLHFVIKTDITG
ncbi:hypothetical protein KCP73_07780 [Salmonella enterica subsp. enterica]|nr:hypothetical protein KCP73_07780 [Salmonella enterica subsp. enterica]